MSRAEVWCAGTSVGESGPGGWAFVLSYAGHLVPGCGMVARCDRHQAGVRAAAAALGAMESQDEVSVTLVLTPDQPAVEDHRQDEVSRRMREAVRAAEGAHGSVSWDYARADGSGGTVADEVVKLARAAAGKAAEHAAGRGVVLGGGGP